MLPNTRSTVPDAILGPLETTHSAVGALGGRSDTLGGGCFGGGLHHSDDAVVDEGRDFGGCCHPAGEESFVGKHVDGAVNEGGLAGDFVGDAAGEENVDGLVEELVDSVFPDCASVGLGVLDGYE